MQVGRRDLHAVIKQRQQIIGDDALNRAAIPKFQSNPQPVQLRPGQKRRALGFIVIIEFSDKINAPDILDGKVAMFAFRREQIEDFRFPKSRWIEVSANRGAIEKSHDYFFMRGGWGAYFHGIELCMRALRVKRSYVMLSGLLLSSGYFSKV